MILIWPNALTYKAPFQSALLLLSALMRIKSQCSWVESCNLIGPLVASFPARLFSNRTLGRKEGLVPIASTVA